jgi:putative glutamine amidotransferase
MSADLETRPTKRGPLVDALVLERPYSTRVLEGGGVPLICPVGLSDDDVDVVLDVVDGVVLTGGDFDVDPALFGETPHPSIGTLKPDRTAVEIALFRGAQRRGLPILGICGGMQLINVLLGGTLWQDLPSQHPSPVAHSQKQTKDLAGHSVGVVAGTALADLCGAGPLGVNSTHHQAIKAVAPDLIACAVADDGVVEGIEGGAGGPFLLGVQWHPESMFEDAHRAIYRGLIRAASARMGDTSRHVR